MDVFTADEMRACDRIAIDDYGIAGICLMEAAGMALVDACREEVGGILRDKHITILCGKGNNGGDGFVAARHLISEGATIHLFLFGAVPDELTGDAAVHFAPIPRLLANQGSVVEVILLNADIESSNINIQKNLDKSDIVLDCLYGTGFRPPLPPLVASVASLVRESARPVISCDIPSGIHADTGADGGEAAFTATRTVTLAGYKRGLLFYPGASYAGKVTVAPIGMPPTILHQSASATLTTRSWVRSKLPPRRQSRDANKGRFGSVLVVAGSAGMMGAATLTGLSALRAGAGLVYLAMPRSVLDVAAVLAPELVLHGLPETDQRSHGGDGAIDMLLALAEKADVVAIGPGLGGNTVTKLFVQTFVKQLSIEKPLVMDADGLNAIADVGGEVVQHRTGDNTILTPHPGEAGRLLGETARIIQDDRAGSVHEMARQYHATVLLKGSRTVIATDIEPDRLYINRPGSVALATAGSGDVLTGVLAALLADRERRFTAVDAARIGAFLHALSGEICASNRGAVGTIATEIRDTLPQARAVLYDESYWTGSQIQE